MDNRASCDYLNSACTSSHHSRSCTEGASSTEPRWQPCRHASLPVNVLFVPMDMSTVKLNFSIEIVHKQICSIDSGNVYAISAHYYFHRTPIWLPNLQRLPYKYMVTCLLGVTWLQQMNSLVSASPTSVHSLVRKAGTIELCFILQIQGQYTFIVYTQRLLTSCEQGFFFYY